MTGILRIEALDTHLKGRLRKYMEKMSKNDWWLATYTNGTSSGGRFSALFTFTRKKGPAATQAQSIFTLSMKRRRTGSFFFTHGKAANIATIRTLAVVKRVTAKRRALETESGPCFLLSGTMRKSAGNSAVAWLLTIPTLLGRAVSCFPKRATEGGFGTTNACLATKQRISNERRVTTDTRIRC
eukprot:5959705-Amphidinium_carterae.1